MAILLFIAFNKQYNMDNNSTYKRVIIWSPSGGLADGFFRFLLYRRIHSVHCTFV